MPYSPLLRLGNTQSSRPTPRHPTHRLLRVLRLQVQQLGHDDVGEVVVNRTIDAHNALAEEAGVDVKGPLPP